MRSILTTDCGNAKTWESNRQLVLEAGKSVQHVLNETNRRKQKTKKEAQ